MLVLPDSIGKFHEQTQIHSTLKSYYVRNEANVILFQFLLVEAKRFVVCVILTNQMVVEHMVHIWSSQLMYSTFAFPPLSIAHWLSPSVKFFVHLYSSGVST